MKHIATNGTVFEYNPDFTDVFINGNKIYGPDLIEFVGKYYIAQEIAKLEKLEPAAYLNWKATRTS